MQFVNRFVSRLKTKRSPLDVSDFVARRPGPPTEAEMGAWLDRTYGEVQAAPEALAFMKRRMLFDVLHRCGAGGRCLHGDYRCRFPVCFHCRPVVKGGEVFAERVGFEAVAAKRHKDIALLSLRDDLPGAVTAIDAAQSKLAADAGGVAQLTGDAAEDHALLATWRAALLVNQGRDEAAVRGLVEAAESARPEARVELIGAAAGWATLADMERRFFAHHCKEYPGFVSAFADRAQQRPELLPVVLAACGADGHLLQHCAHSAFAKEVTAIVSRAQASQDSGDTSEDPIGTPVVADSVRLYSSGALGREFWDHFLRLALLPPLAADAAAAEGPEAQSDDDTPRHILDALGRSMLLHHIAALYGPPPGAEPRGPQPGDPERPFPVDAASAQDAATAARNRQRAVVARMQELLALVRGYHEEQAKKGAPADAKK